MTSKIGVFASLLLILIAASPLGGCGKGPEAPTELPPSTVQVVTTITPHVTALPSMEVGGADRPTGRVEDDGTGADFVLGEVVVMTRDRVALESVIAPFGGRIVATTDPAQADPALGALDPQHLVAFSTDGVDASKLPADLARLSPKARSDLRVSSEAGLATLAVAAQLASSGLATSIQFIAEGGDLIGRSVIEGDQYDLSDGYLATFPGEKYTRNAFQWPHLSSAGPMAHGVAEAWRLLAASGRLGNRVRVAVIDGGFAGGYMPGVTAISTIPGRAPLETTNTMKCGGSSCPWHGTRVAQVLGATLGDSVGTVGTGAPVVELVTVTTLGDMFTMMGSYVAASASGAKVITTSITVPVPVLLSFSVLPLERLTAEIGKRQLLFAAAGNDGRNVDSQDCFLGICWEKTWVYPCENDGVRCVGGTEWNSRDRSSNSAHGGQVAMFGPMRVFVGAAPDTAAANRDQISLGSGTSYSTPFVAGVAALVWAANPALGANDVWARLVDTAHPGGSEVTRVVNALSAVRSAIAESNIAPFARIVTPTPGSTFEYGGLGVTLAAEIGDAEDPTSALAVEWSTPEEGVIGTTAELTYAFPAPGNRTITLRVRDTGGREATGSVSIQLGNRAPAPRIDAPTNGAMLYAGVPFAISGSAMDVNEAVSGFECSRLHWSIEEDLLATANGCNGTLKTNVRGTVHVVLETTDSHGATGRASVAVNVGEPPATLLPLVTIILPTAGSSPDARFAQDLQATAIDPDGGGIVSYVWTVRSPTGDFPETTVGSGATLNWRPADVVPLRCGAGRPTIVRCTATDDTGLSGSAEVAVTYYFGPC
ncbi:MAG: S8 family serine peptidase [Myxococcaceae bacterium]